MAKKYNLIYSIVIPVGRKVELGDALDSTNVLPTRKVHVLTWIKHDVLKLLIFFFLLSYKAMVEAKMQKEKKAKVEVQKVPAESLTSNMWTTISDRIESKLSRKTYVLVLNKN